ncbi:MAG: lipopolysaccharide biosynthesis protein [Kofleriaceae bacterium]
MDAQGVRLRRDVAWNLVPVALLAIVGLGMNFMIGRWWGADALGAFNLVTPAFFAFAVLGAGGIQFSVLRAIAEDPDDEDRVATVVVGALLPAVVLALAATGLCIALAAPIGALVKNADVETGLWWVAPGLFCFAVNKVLFGVVNGLRRMRAFAVYTSLRYVLIAVGIVLAHIWNAPADHLAVIWTFTEGTLLVVLLCELLSTVQLRRARGWWAWAKRHIDYGSRGLLATLSFEINSKIDVWMLGVALPESLVGIYALASTLFEGAAQLGVVVQNNVNPMIARDLALGKRVDVDGLVKRTRRWFVPAMIAACIASIFIYPFAIPTLVGDPAFHAGTTSFAILMVGLALTTPWLPFNQVLLMGSRPGWHTVYVCAVFGVSVAGNLLLIPHLALEGAALSTAIATVFSAALLRVLARWQTGVRL